MWNKIHAHFFRSRLFVTNGVVYDVKIVLRVCLITVSEFPLLLGGSFKKFSNEYWFVILALINVNHIKFNFNTEREKECNTKVSQLEHSDFNGKY